MKLAAGPARRTLRVRGVRPLVVFVAMSVLAAGATAAATRSETPPVPPPMLSAEEQASAAAAASGQPVEIPSLTTETKRVEALPDGGFQAEVTAFPARVRDDRGIFRTVDTTLVERSDGSVGPAVSAVSMSFSGGGDQALAQIEDDGKSLGLGWPAAGDLPKPKLTGSSALYEEVRPGVDLVARAGFAGFSTFVVIKNEQAAADPAVQTLRSGLRVVGIERRARGLTAFTGRNRCAANSISFFAVWRLGRAGFGTAGRSDFDHKRQEIPQEDCRGRRRSGGVVMGIYNTLLLGVDETCRRCGNVFPLTVQFEYGEVKHHQYKIGDEIRWGGLEVGFGGPFVELLGYSEDCPNCGLDSEAIYVIEVCENRPVRFRRAVDVDVERLEREQGKW